MATNKRLIKSNEGGAAVPTSFNTVLWTGDNTATRDITGVGFQPDLVWYKKRSGVNQQIWADSVRGATKLIYSSLTNAEQTEPIDGYLSNFITDGFSVSQGTRNRDDVNASGQDYVAWCWKAGGAAVTNTDGTITSQVSANTEAGFSVVNWTAISNYNNRIGHGLGVAPKVMLTKRRDVASDWYFYNTILDGSYDLLILNETQASEDRSSDWLPTSTTISSNVFTGGNYITYCFAEVAGFSKFGSYVGTSAAGNKQTTGFEPAFIMFKRTNGLSSWYIVDNKRDSSEYKTLILLADESIAEINSAPNGVKFESDGFSFNGEAFNNSGWDFVYMAFANQF